MSKQLKIFLWKVVALLIVGVMVAMLFIFCTGTGVTKSSYAFPDYSTLTGFNFKQETYTRFSHTDKDGVDIYKEYKLVEENANYKLYFNEDDLDIALVHIASEEVWFSNPSQQTIDLSPNSATGMKSQFTIRSVDKKTEAIVSKSSYGDCKYYQEVRDINKMDEGKDIMKQYYITTNENGGLRVVYIMGKIPLKYMFPVMVPEDEFESILDTVKKEAGLVAVMMLKEQYKLVNKDTWNDPKTFAKNEQEDVLSNAPNTERLISEGQSFYAIYRTDIWNNTMMLNNVEKYFSYTGITEEQIDNYNDIAGFADDNSSLFMVPLDYSLEEDGLKVTVKAEDIEYDSSRYDITNISLMEYFGSADSTEEGYIVVPDGSGALINFNNEKLHLTSAMSIPLYGLDRGKYLKEAPAMVEQGYLPIWGLKKENSSLFCIIESGEGVATVKADVNRGAKAATNKAWSDFLLVTSDDISFMGMTSLLSYQKTPVKTNLEIKYSVLPAEQGHEYSDMAAYYREYLINKGQLKEQTAKENINFNLELEGAIDAFGTTFGVEYQYINTLTSYAQAQEILSKLTEGGVDNISVRYRGWANNGLYNSFWNRVRLLSEMGTKDELKQLMSFAQQNNIDIYYDTDLVSVASGEDSIMEGFAKFSDVSREISGDNIRYKQFDLMKKDTSMGSFYIAKPAKVADAASTLIKDLQELGINTVSLGRMGNMLTGDYDENNMQDRTQVQKVYSDVSKLFADSDFKVANVGGNSYMLNGTSVLFELPNTSSKNYMADEAIPFYQMVVHGLISYSGEAINQSGNPQRSLLNAVEYGAGLFYRWMYAGDVEMYDNYFEEMYSMHYKGWLEEAVQNYKRYNDELGHVAQLKMTYHDRITEDLAVTEYEDGTKVYVNYGKTEASVDGISVPANDYFVVRKGA